MERNLQQNSNNGNRRENEEFGTGHGWGNNHGRELTVGQ